MESHSVNSVDPFKNKTKSWTLKENVKLKKKKRKDRRKPSQELRAGVLSVTVSILYLQLIGFLLPHVLRGICWNRCAQCAGPLSWEAMLRQVWEAMGHCLSPHETSHPQTASRLSPLWLPASYRTMLPVMATESCPPARPPRETGGFQQFVTNAPACHSPSERWGLQQGWDRNENNQSKGTKSHSCSSWSL